MPHPISRQAPNARRLIFFSRPAPTSPHAQPRDPVELQNGPLALVHDLRHQRLHDGHAIQAREILAPVWGISTKRTPSDWFPCTFPFKSSKRQSLRGFHVVDMASLPQWTFIRLPVAVSFPDWSMSATDLVKAEYKVWCSFQSKSLAKPSLWVFHYLGLS